MPRFIKDQPHELTTKPRDPNAPPRLQCRHIQPSGQRCGSPSLRNEPFCYYHHTTRKPAPKHGAIQLPRKHTAFDLPRPEDRISVQHSIGEVLRLIAADEIDPRRAGLLLYGLQIASHNIAHEKTTNAPELGPIIVEDITDDPEQGLLAPESTFQEAPRERTFEEIMTERWEQDKQERLEREQ